MENRGLFKSCSFSQPQATVQVRVSPQHLVVSYDILAYSTMVNCSRSSKFACLQARTSTFSFAHVLSRIQSSLLIRPHQDLEFGDL